MENGAVIEIGNFALLRPLWLLGLLPIGLFCYRAMRNSSNYGGWERVMAPQFLEFLKEKGALQGAKGRGSWPFFALLALCLIIGLSGPALRKTDAPALRNRDVVFVVLDLSQSMIQGGNFADAQAVAALTMQGALERPVAMAVYGGETYLVSGPTNDPAKLLSAISVMDEDIMPDQGSRPDYALEFTRGILEDGNSPHADVLLISDGGGINPNSEHEARFLNEEGYRLSTVFIAPKEAQMGVPDPSPDALAGLAALGGGQAFQSSEKAEISHYLRTTGNLMRERANRPLFYEDYGSYLLIIALIFSGILFRFRGAT